MRKDHAHGMIYGSEELSKHHNIVNKLFKQKDQKIKRSIEAWLLQSWA